MLYFGTRAFSGKHFGLAWCMGQKNVLLKNGRGFRDRT